MSLLALLKGNGPSGFGYGSTADDVTAGLDLKGRTMLVTGCNSGLGLETLRTLTKRGVRVIGTSRTAEKARAACATVEGETVPLACELSDPASVRACVAAVKEAGATLDAILCNAGVMALPKLEQAFGYELQFFTNHIGHFILVTGLLDRLAANGRVVVTSSDAHLRAPKAGIELDNLSGEKNYGPWTAYGQSKLANILFTKQLAKRLGGSGQTANTLHPGVIKTNLGRSMPAVARGALALAGPLLLKTPAQGAATQCYLATNPKLGGATGEYFSHCNLAQSSPISRDAQLAQRLWDESERIVAGLDSKSRS
jgi:NAD(P)-dependent dehydrogenase (short-subunit alcohol dehydrogenase family)